MYEIKKLCCKIQKKIDKKGNNYYFNIPIQLIRSEIINPVIKYEIRIFKINQKSL